MFSILISSLSSLKSLIQCFSPYKFVTDNIWSFPHIFYITFIVGFLIIKVVVSQSTKEMGKYIKVQKKYPTI